MFGLVVFGAIGLYFLLSIWVARQVIRYARNNGKSAKRWGWGAVLVMYLIPFWDWIPTVGVHQFYCAKDSGFLAYKTLDQWKAENPGVMETLVANKTAMSIQNAYMLNQRFNWVIKQVPYFPLNHMMREEWQVVDSKTGEVLARYVNYSASHERRQAGWTGWKFWLDSPYCIGGGSNQDAFRSFRDNFRGAKK
jgi:hypothetical protein